MKSIADMTQLELAAYVHSHLRTEKIEVVLSGGAAVSYFTNNIYLSKDIDLINLYSENRKNIRGAMEKIGFREISRYFAHPQSEYIIEFPAGPLAVGKEPVKEIIEVRFSTGSLRIISPTECVKDRLSAFYYWSDFQALAQASMVTKDQLVDLNEIRRWSETEGKTEEYKLFLENISKKGLSSGQPPNQEN
jgi:hypothetical protein